MALEVHFVLQVEITFSMGHITRALLNSCLKRSFSSFFQPSEFRSFSSSSRDVPDVAKLLVANRGEIACRVLATAKRLGMSTLSMELLGIPPLHFLLGEPRFVLLL